MARRERKVICCDRCPKDTRADGKESFTVGGIGYEIDLCERHREMFSRDLSMWARMAREVAPVSTSGLAENAETWRRLHRIEGELGVSPVGKDVPAVQPARIPDALLPENMRGWQFTDKALELQDRHGFSDMDVLQTVAAPEKVEPQPKTGYRLHRRDRLVAVVDVADRYVISVLKDTSPSPAGKKESVLS